MNKFKSNRAFGVELEVGPEISKTDIKKLIQMMSDKEIIVTDWAQSIRNDYWHVKQDSTCGPNGHLRADYGWEISSYIGKGIKDIIHIKQVCQYLADAGVSVNDNCGLHVHADCHDFNEKQIGQLFLWWLKIENLLASMVPFRRALNKHAKLYTIHYADVEWDWSSPNKVWRKIKPDNFSPHNNENKRFSLNFVNYAHWLYDQAFGRPTVELRLPEGTLVGEDVANWIKLFLVIITQSKLSCPVDSTHYDLYGLMDFLALNGQVSPGLKKLKCWICSKILTFSTSTLFCEQAREIYDQQ